MMNNSQTLCAALKTTVNQITSYVVQKILSSCFNSFQSQMVDLKKKKKNQSQESVGNLVHLLHYLFCYQYNPAIEYSKQNKTNTKNNLLIVLDPVNHI